MFPGVLALLERSWRVDARVWGQHLIRLGLVIGIYFALLFAIFTGTGFGAPGLRFLFYIVNLNLVFITLTGVGFFSTAISEEKEEDTLGLMLMAGISPNGILLGKSIGRLTQVLLLIAVQYPFTLLAVTMGGVNPIQVHAVYAAMFAYLFMLSGVGLCCSTLNSRNRTAVLWTAVFVAIYFIFPPFMIRLVLLPSGRTAQIPEFVAWVDESCIFYQVNSILASNFQQTTFSRQVISNTVIGMFGYFLSVILFGLAAQVPSTESTSRGLLQQTRGRTPFGSPGRPRFNPFVWKDFHFIGGGTVGLILRVALIVFSYFVVCDVTDRLGGGWNWGPPHWGTATGTFVSLMVFGVTLDAGQLMSRCLGEEIRGQTLGSLLMLPHSTPAILYSKLLGVFLAWLPGLTAIVFVLLLTADGLNCAHAFWEYPGAMLLFAVHFVLVPHVAMVAAFRVSWGGLALGIGTAIAVACLSFVTILCFHSGPNSVINFFVSFAILAVCLSCHLAIVLLTDSTVAR